MTEQYQETLSQHARRRGAQSNLCSRDLELVRKYGVLEHRTGVRFYFLRSREVERFRSLEPRLAKLQGIVMIVAKDSDMVITIYRNPRALHDIRRKPKVRYGRVA